MPPLRFAFLLICLATAPVAGFAQEAEVESDEILVVAGGEGYRLRADHLRDAQKAFAKRHAEYAPQSILYFRVDPQEGASREGLRMALRSDEAEVPLALDADGRFALPPLPERHDFRLVANRPAGSLALRPLVMSPGTSETDRLLGDLRLECRVVWALAQHRMPLPFRGLIEAAGDCGSRMIQLTPLQRAPMREAVLDVGGERTPLTLSANRRAFNAPIADMRVPSSAHVRIAFDQAVNP